MGILYLDCGMGAAGDMLAAALLELVPDREAVLQKVNGLGLPGVRAELCQSRKCGITGSHFSVTVCGEKEHSFDHHAHTHDHEHVHDHEHHHHSGMEEITHLVEHLPVSDKVRQDVENVYEIIAQAESKIGRAHV